MPIGIALFEPQSTPRAPRKSIKAVCSMKNFLWFRVLGVLRELGGGSAPASITSVPPALTKIHKYFLASVEISRNLFMAN
jgi:hypothetical protein